VTAATCVRRSKQGIQSSRVRPASFLAFNNVAHSVKDTAGCLASDRCGDMQVQLMQDKS
jgi:hypothetical protein